MTEKENHDKLLEEALLNAQRANNAKSDFLAKMSHEMRTPLNAIIGMSGMSLEAGRLSPEDHKNIEAIYNAGETLLSTVNDILDISKIEAGKLELVPVEYDIPSLVNDTVTQNTMRIGKKPIKLILDISEDMFTNLYGDELRIKQIANNLLSNAIKYTKEGTVTFSMNCSFDSGKAAGQQGDIVWLTITISDTGMGIRPEDIDKLFSGYTQLDLEANRKTEGTGLGLSLTKNLCEMMNGTITAKSEYGKGSIFTVRVQQKFVKDTRFGAELLKNLSSFQFSDGKYEKNTGFKRVSIPYARVLVVDDNQTNLDIAKGLMKPYGMVIDCVDSGQKAIDLVRSETVKYNTIFMDHMMPGMDGIEAVRIIREWEDEKEKEYREQGVEFAGQTPKQSGFARIPIVALTANALAGNEEMFMSKGFQAFLSKPINISRLDEIVQNWVRNIEQEKILTDQGLLVDGQLLPNLQEEQDRRIILDRRGKVDRRIIKKKFAGMDINQGIEKFKGNEKLFFDVLRSYVTNTRPQLKLLENVNEESLRNYAITVHGIKGSSWGIFANMVGDAAAELENAANAGNLEYIAAHNPRFLDAAWKLINDLDEMFKEIEKENPKPKKDKLENTILLKLLSACKMYNMDDVDAAMTEIEMYNYTSDEELASWLRENVDMMNFREIVIKLEKLQLTV